MEIHLSEDMRTAMQAAPFCDAGGLRVTSGEQSVAVCRYWQTGFSVAADAAGALRGRVELYDGERHLGSGLVVAQGVEDGVRSFAFKRFNRAMPYPPLDFVPGDTETIAVATSPETHRRPEL